MNRKVFYAAIAVILILTVAMVRGAACSKGLFGAEAAAWAQAGGSIAALLIAVYVGQLALEAEERRRRKALIDLVNGIGDATEMALSQMRPVNEAVNARNPAAIATAREGVDASRLIPLAAYLKLDIDRWPSAILYSRALTVDNEITNLRKYLDDAANLFTPGSQVWLVAGRYVKSLNDAEMAFAQSLAGVTIH